MRKQKNPDEQLSLPEEVHKWAEALLTKEGAVIVDEFDRLAMDELRKHYKQSELDAPMMKNDKPTKRTRGENLLDWIKAHWTSGHKTIRIGRVLIWLPTDGWWRLEPLVAKQTAAHALRALADMARSGEACLFSDD